MNIPWTLIAKLVGALALIGLGFGLGYKFEHGYMLAAQATASKAQQDARNYKTSNDTLRSSIDSYNAAMQKLQKDDAARLAFALANQKKADASAQIDFKNADSIMGLRVSDGGNTCADAMKASKEFDDELTQERQHATP